MANRKRELTPPRNNREWEAAREIISQLDVPRFEGNSRPRTIHSITHRNVLVRVDIQYTFLRDRVRYVNVQVQIENRSVAGVNIRGGYDFGSARINDALMNSLCSRKIETLDCHPRHDEL